MFGAYGYFCDLILTCETIHQQNTQRISNGLFMLAAVDVCPD